MKRGFKILRSCKKLSLLFQLYIVSALRRYNPIMDPITKIIEVVRGMKLNIAIKK